MSDYFYDLRARPESDVWFIEKVFSKTFSNKSKDKAYDDLMRWFKETMLVKVGKDIKNGQLCKMCFDIEELDKELPAFKLHVFFRFPESQFRQNTCKACKEYSQLFYIRNHVPPCGDCKAIGYVNRMEDYMKEKKTTFSTRLKDKVYGR